MPVNCWRLLPLALAVLLLPGCVYVPTYGYGYDPISPPPRPRPWLYPPDPYPYAAREQHFRRQLDSEPRRRRYMEDDDAFLGERRDENDVPRPRREELAEREERRDQVIPPAPLGTPETGKKAETPPSGGNIPTATRGSRPGRVKVPFPPYNELDVSGMAAGSLAKDPATGKVFRLP